MKRRIPKKWVAVMLLSGLFLLNFFLLDRGFCYSEMTFLSKRQMLERVTFGISADKMSEIEKAAILKSHNLTEYPNNCVFEKGRPLALSSFDELIWGLLGRKYFSVDCIYPRAPTEHNNNPYSISYGGIGSCGVPLSDSFGESIDEERFKALLRKNAKFWESQKQQ